MLAAVAPLLLLAGCNGQSDPELDACVSAIKEHLRTPSTFKLAEAGEPGAPRSIQFDAANEYGAPIRHRGFCTYKPGQAVQWLDATDPDFSFPEVLELDSNDITAVAAGNVTGEGATK